MSWIDRTLPKLRFWKKRDVPENLWSKCKNCGELIFTEEFHKNLHVCPNCGHHHRIGPEERFDALFDNKAYELIALDMAKDDPLGFKDSKRYPDRLKEARSKTKKEDAFEVAKGTIGGLMTTVGVQNFQFMAGSMGQNVGNAFNRGVETALEHKTPFVVFSASGGARMQESILSLMQMPRTTAMLNRLRRANLPYVVVLTDPTTGGVTASFAMLGDIQLAEPNALIGFAGQRVIENTIREQLPEGFQRSEYLLEHGMIDAVVHRRDLPQTLATMLGILTHTDAGAASGIRKALAAPVEE
ncbi:MAG: acetyl-CoA carboxylase, carboxyltransferase subunit beta [Pseudomonadota bacterium]